MYAEMEPLHGSMMLHVEVQWTEQHRPLQALVQPKG